MKCRVLPIRCSASVPPEFSNPGGNVQISFEFSNWNLAAKTKEADFVFAPAPDAIQIPMMTLDEMDAAFRAVR